MGLVADAAESYAAGANELLGRLFERAAAARIEHLRPLRGVPFERELPLLPRCVPRSGGTDADLGEADRRQQSIHPRPERTGLKRAAHSDELATKVDAAIRSVAAELQRIHRRRRIHSAALLCTAASTEGVRVDAADPAHAV